MEQYVGLDVSKKVTSISVVSGRRERSRCKTVTSVEEIAAAVLRHAPDAVVVGLETGPQSTYLYHGLQAAGLPVVCMDARHAHNHLKMLINKTDSNDAFGLARILEAGMAKPVAVKSMDAHHKRSLLAARKKLVESRQSLQVQIRGLLENVGLKVGRGQGQRFVEGARAAVADHPLLATVVASLLRAWEALRLEAVELYKLIRRLAREDENCRRLMTIDGVGPIGALAFAAAVDDPTRFAKSRSVGAYFGLTPTRHQSGQKDVPGRVSKQGDSFVRATLFECANAVLRIRRPSALRDWALALQARQPRGGRTVALTALARRLAVIMHRVLVDGTVFDNSRLSAVAPAAS